MLKIFNDLHDRLIQALNSIDRPNFVGTSDDGDMRHHLWERQGEYGDELIVAVLRGQSVRFVVTPSGEVKMHAGYQSLGRDDLFAVNAYMRACEEAIAGLDSGEVLVQRRDIDDALGSASPEFRKTAAFRRLDDAIDGR